MTPYEKFKSLGHPERFLKLGITMANLDATATAMSDNEAAEQMNVAKLRLFQSINRRSKRAA